MPRATGLQVLAMILVAVNLSARAGRDQASPGPSAPQSQVATPPRAGKVFLSGENPVVFLFDRVGGEPETFVSFWRIHWSPVGPGHVCYVTSGREGTPGTLRVALFDNQALFEYLTKDVLGTYNKAYLERPFTPKGGATFGSRGDSIRERRETCRADGLDVELTWSDLRPPGLVDILAGSRPTNPFGITYLRIPVGRAAVTINGKAAPGLSVPDESFLAFGETWIK